MTDEKDPSETSASKADETGLPRPRASYRGAVKFSLSDFVSAEAPSHAPSRSLGTRHVVTGPLGEKPRPSDLMAEEPVPPARWRAKIVTLFPEAFPGVLGLSLTGKAMEEGIWGLETIELRPFGIGRHRNVDDTPAGGGAGMVLRADVLGRALDVAARGTPKDRARWPVVYMSPRGPRFDQKMARRFAACEGMTILCGRFEGVDERLLEEYAVEEISLGDYVLTGGEIAAQAMLDATVRLLPGVLGNADSTVDESHSNGLLEHPQYTRPTEWRGRTIPDVLMSGHHGNIDAWRREMSEKLTEERRPDLWEAYLAARAKPGK